MQLLACGVEVEGLRKLCREKANGFRSSKSSRDEPELVIASQRTLMRGDS